MSKDQPIIKTPLYNLHVKLGAKMVEFAGYSMPLQYSGIIEEHIHTRTSAGLFDVSHMGQISVHATSFDIAAKALERVVSSDIQNLDAGSQKYSLLLNEEGGIVDDCMVARLSEEVAHAHANEAGALQLHIVVNASRKSVDLAHMRKYCGDTVVLVPRDDRALLAFQGPLAVSVMEQRCPEVKDMVFMQVAQFELEGQPCFVSRSGYTGEDGFEISVPVSYATTLAEHLLSDTRVRPVGLGARDSLRLEAGMPLYGNDIDEHTTPVEAGLSFAVGKNQRQSGAFLGAEAILAQINEKRVPKKRVGLSLEGRLPARRGSEVFLGEEAVGFVSSGLFSPSLGHPIAMAYVPQELAKTETNLVVAVRANRIPAKVVKLPFIPPRYAR